MDIRHPQLEKRNFLEFIIPAMEYGASFTAFWQQYIATVFIEILCIIILLTKNLSNL